MKKLFSPDVAPAPSAPQQEQRLFEVMLLRSQSSLKLRGHAKYLLHCNRSFYMRMGIVSFNDKIFVFEIENIFHCRIYFHLR